MPKYKIEANRFEHRGARRLRVFKRSILSQEVKGKA